MRALLMLAIKQLSIRLFQGDIITGNTSPAGTAVKHGSYGQMDWGQASLVYHLVRHC